MSFFSFLLLKLFCFDALIYAAAFCLGLGYENRHDQLLTSQPLVEACSL
jgi:hypothetical protein